jgi:hypothetical protein
MSMSSKQVVADLLAELPDEVTLTEIAEELSILAAVDRSEKQIAAGNWISQEDIKNRTAEWASK